MILEINYKVFKVFHVVGMDIYSGVFGKFGQ